MPSNPFSHAPAHVARESDRAPKPAPVRDPRPDDLGHEGFVSTIKRNTSDSGERVDRGD